MHCPYAGYAEDEESPDAEDAELLSLRSDPASDTTLDGLFESVLDSSESAAELLSDP